MLHMVSLLVWVKLGVSLPLAVPITYGCPDQTKLFGAGGVIGRDILSVLKANIVPLWVAVTEEGLKFDKDLWKHGADYACYVKKGFTNEYKRALIAVSGGVNIEIVDKNLPAAYLGAIDDEQITSNCKFFLI